MNSQTASLLRHVVVLVLVTAQLLTPLTALAQPSTDVLGTSATDRQTDRQTDRLDAGYNSGRDA
jgi:hypothetical protein